MLISNQMDTCLDLRPSNIKTILDQNPDVSTWTGRDPPYGYLDWWPIALGFNNLEAPFADAEIRWAINYAIDRQQLVEVGWQGAGNLFPAALSRFPTPAPFHGPDRGFARALSSRHTRPSQDRGDHAAPRVVCSKKASGPRKARHSKSPSTCIRISTTSSPCWSNSYAAPVSMPVSE